MTLPHHRGPGARHRLGARRPLRHHARGLPRHGHRTRRPTTPAPCRWPWAPSSAAAPTPRSEALRNYGLDTGLAFQIQDDLLNLVGTEEATKKDFRSDITEGKRTLVVVHALQHSDQRPRPSRSRSCRRRSSDPEVLAEAVDIMEESGSIDYARNYAENLTSIAKTPAGRVVLPPSHVPRLAGIHGRLVRESSASARGRCDMSWIPIQRNDTGAAVEDVQARLARHRASSPKDAITAF